MHDNGHMHDKVHNEEDYLCACSRCNRTDRWRQSCLAWSKWAQLLLCECGVTSSLSDDEARTGVITKFVVQSTGQAVVVNAR